MLVPAMGASTSIFEAAHSAKWLGRKLTRIVVCAHLHFFWATRFEVASYADACQIRRLAINDRKSRTAGGHAGEVPPGEAYQRLSVGMKRPAKYGFRVPFFNNLAGIHHRNSIGKSWKNGWIMADHQEGGAVLFTNFTDHGDYFR